MSDHHGVNNLVLRCMDYRFREQLDEWIDKTFGGADLLSLPGAAKTINDDSTQGFVLGTIELGIDKHGVNTVSIVNHLNKCGGYGKAGEHDSHEAERAFHVVELQRAAEVIKQRFPYLTVRLFIAHLAEQNRMQMEEIE